MISTIIHGPVDREGIVTIILGDLSKILRVSGAGVHGIVVVLVRVFGLGFIVHQGDSCVENLDILKEVSIVKASKEGVLVAPQEIFDADCLEKATKVVF